MKNKIIETFGQYTDKKFKKLNISGVINSDKNLTEMKDFQTDTKKQQDHYSESNY